MGLDHGLDLAQRIVDQRKAEAAPWSGGCSPFSVPRHGDPNGGRRGGLSRPL